MAGGQVGQPSVRASGNNSSMRNAANASGLAAHGIPVANSKTTKSSLNTNEKTTAPGNKLILSKNSTEKKVKSRAGSNNK